MNIFYYTAMEILLDLNNTRVHLVRNKARQSLP
jgi:hypothetical protein